MEIKLHTVGNIVSGDKYVGWCIFVQTYGKQGSYLVLLSDDKTFGKDENGELVEGEGYDSWMPDMPSLEYHFAQHNWEIEWLDWKPAWIKDVAE